MIKFVTLSPILLICFLFECWEGRSIKTIYRDLTDRYSIDLSIGLSLFAWLVILIIVGCRVGFVVIETTQGGYYERTELF